MCFFFQAPKNYKADGEPWPYISNVPGGRVITKRLGASRYITCIYGGRFDGDCYYYGTSQGAIEGHVATVQNCRQAELIES